MNVYVNQTITIQTLRVEGLQNSSILQIGTTGVLKPISYSANTGGFTEPAPQMQQPFGGVEEITGPLVPFAPES
ncbi:spore germination protein GerPB [Bacillus sp. Marseille-Q3570]|uniref:spore germination protein GerPB n=1 Tax=Bacillus sp. Marseille-Q3570 TaxID=2963522 RepID=UPI0021B838F0|nr:spore germination protein GerPB [Bacillus sp. Marseille-Q3570]